MPDRRAFLRHSTVATTTALAATSLASAQESEPNPQVTGYNYRLPSFPQGSRLLFIGDSITDMKWGRNEKDRNHYLGHSYVYLIASRLGVDMPQAQLEFFNRGHSGNRLQDLRNRWPKDVIDMKPDLLSILVGVNDLRGKGDLAKWEADYRHILTASRQANEKLKIVMLDPFILPSGRWMTKGGDWDKSRARIDGMGEIVSKLAKEFKAVQIPTQVVFNDAAKAVTPEHWIWDGVHPLPQGHELIARRWLHEVSARWH